jgi:hypothetical protein
LKELIDPDTMSYLSQNFKEEVFQKVLHFKEQEDTDWFDVAIAWALGRGMHIDTATEFARKIEAKNPYETWQ